MVLPTSGSISLTAIQTEFGGTSPTGINEYYNGGSYVTGGNPTIPAAGAIAMDDFYGTRRLSSLAEIIAAMKNTNYAVVRNFLLSRTSFADGLETNTALAMSYSTSASYRYATSVTGNVTWPTSYTAAFEALQNISYITIVIRNAGSGAVVVPSVNVNGISRATTTLFSGTTQISHRISYVQVPVNANPFSGLSISATFTKSSSNNENLQEIYILPGRWNPLTPVSGNTTLSVAVQARDIAIGFSAGAEDAFYPTKGNFSGPVFTEIIRRTSRWYDNTRMRYAITDAAGTLSFSPGTSTVSTPDSLTTTTNAGVLTVFRYVGS